jgi:cyanate permease
VGKTGFALGLAMAVNQVAAILVPPLLGVLRDGTHGYRLGWGCLALLTAAALAAVLSGRRVTSGGRLSRG